MTPEEAVRVRLLSLSAVTALVLQRVYLAKLPPNPTFPAVRVTLVSDITSYHLRGGIDLKRASVQVDAYAHESASNPYASAIELAEAINGDDTGSGLSGYTGAVGGSPAVVFEGIFKETRRQSYDPAVLNLVTISQDYAVHFTGA